MYAIIVTIGGVALLAALVGLAHAAGWAIGAIALAFVPVWFGASAFHMWMGVTQAGYPVAQEFPIFLAVFAVPTILAMVVWWRNAPR